MYDLIVVGGGPAGASAGRAGALAGLSTLVIERAAFPRHKPCGGAFSERGMAWLDFPLPEELIEKDVYGIRAYYGDRRVDVAKDYRIAVLVSRGPFDAFLLDKAKEAGAEAKTGERAAGFSEEGGRVRVETANGAYESKYLVLADGAQGRLKNFVRSKDRRADYAVTATADISRPDAEIDAYIRDAIEVYFGIADCAYGWVFPHRGYLSFGIGGLGTKMLTPREKLAEFMATLGFDEAPESRVHVIPIGGLRRKVAAGRVMLAGDAAGFVDPFYGEGISYAIRSGQLAAAAAAEALAAGDDPGALKAYPARCDSEFAADLKYSRFLLRMMYNYPRFYRRIFAAGAGVVDRHCDVAGARMTYAAFLRWLVPRAPFILLKGLFSGG